MHGDLVRLGLLLLVLGPPAGRASPATNAFKARHGAAWKLEHDRVSGRPRKLAGGAIAWPPGTRGEELVDEALRFLTENAAFLGVEPAALRLTPSGVMSSGRGLDVVAFDVAPRGIPVIGGRVTLAVSRGNLIGVHLIGTAPVAEDAFPAVASRDAVARVMAAANLTGTELAAAPLAALRFLPETGGHRLIWNVTLRRQDGPQRLVGRVDARTAALLSLTDETVSACEAVPVGARARRVVGGVRPEQADEAERPELLAFASVGGVAAGVDGFFAPPGSPASASLDGPAVRVACQACSNPAQPAAPAAPGSDVDFGNGGTDHSGNGFATPADRATFFHVEAARRLASRWISLPFLAQPVVVRTNIPNDCNAYWDGASLNFFRSSSRCANTGEIRDVIQHEWGHGLDENDGLPPPGVGVDAATGEAVADIVAILRSRDACIGESFHADPAEHPSDACSGVRDLDELAPGHEFGSPATLTTANVASLCARSGFYRGPLGREGHCEGQILGQAFWHLVTNLVGAQGADAGWETAEALFFDSRALLASYAPADLQSIGMSAYDAFLLADDEGDGIANGTPHAAEINDAFSHHGIAESTLAPDAAEPLLPADPALSAAQDGDPASGLSAIRLDWADTTAAALRLLRADAPDEAFLPLGPPLPPAAGMFLDRSVLAGRTYRYRLVAEDAAGRRSRSATAVVAAPGPLLRVDSLLWLDSRWGDGDGAFDADEFGDLLVTLRNDGSVPATNVSVTDIGTPNSGAALGMPYTPVTFGTIPPGGTAPGSGPFDLVFTRLASPQQDLVFHVASDEGCARLRETIPVDAPDVVLDGFTLDDATGDGDGLWDPGETIRLAMRLRNDGTADAARVDAILEEPDPNENLYVSVIARYSTWGTLPANGLPYANPPPSFTVQATPSAEKGTRVPLRLVVSLGTARYRTFDLELIVGGLPEGRLEWASPIPPDDDASFSTGPIVLQLTDDDGDGVVTECDVPDVVASSREIWLGEDPFLVALSGDTGEILWTNWDRSCVEVDYDAGIAGGDIDGDGRNEVVVASRDHVACAFASDGSLKWRSAYIPFIVAKLSPQIWDLDGDGMAEVVLGNTVLSGVDGSVVWQAREASSGRALVVDLDDDGRLEVITGDGNRTLSFRSDGTPFASGLSRYWMHGAAVNLDTDPAPEIVLVTRGWRLRALDTDGRVLFERSDLAPNGTHPDRSPPACFGDLDGDGRSEIVFPAIDVISAVDDDGATLWSVPTDEASCCSGCTVFDFERDGYPEIVYRDEDNLMVLDGRSGARMWETGVGSWTSADSPVVADVDGDGSAEIVLSFSGVHHTPASYLGPILAFGNPAWAPARPVWNQDEYAVTAVENGGAIVARPAPWWVDPGVFRGQVSECFCAGARPAIERRLPDCGGLEACLSGVAPDERAAWAYTWDFGDGSPPETALVPPCHVFPAPGDYTVSLRAVTPQGCMTETVELIHLGSAPAVDFDPAGACPEAPGCWAAVPAGGAPPLEYRWEFGDGSPQVEGEATCHAFPSPGTYSITLFARDANGCLSEATHDISAVAIPGVGEVSGRGSDEYLRVARVPGNLRFTYEDTGLEAGLYSGDIDALRLIGYTHASTGECRKAGGAIDLVQPEGRRYFLVVASACDRTRIEGPYGADSFGRPAPSARELGAIACP